MSCDTRIYSEYLKSHTINIQYNALLDGLWPTAKEKSTANYLRDNQEKLIKDALRNRKKYAGNRAEEV